MMPLEQASIPVTDPGFTVGWTVFETLRVIEAEVPLLDLHLRRLAGSAAECTIDLPQNLRPAILQLAKQNQGEGRLRVTISGSGFWVLTLEPVASTWRVSGVRCARGPHFSNPFLSGAVKHGSRAPWVVAVRRAGMDEVLLVDENGRFTEGTTCGIVAIVGGELWTAPADSRVLPSTTVHSIVEIAAALGVAVHRVGPLAVGLWDGLYIASATRGLVPVIELDGEAVPVGEPVGARIATALLGGRP